MTGNRPEFGSPEFATLTAGGDDVDFPGILFNCILGVHVKGGPVKRTRSDQREFTKGLISDGKYIDGLGEVIDAIMQKGRKGPKGDDFRLYVTGYGRFFNSDTTGSDTNCGSTTFVGLVSILLTEQLVYADPFLNSKSTDSGVQSHWELMMQRISALP